MTRPLTGLTVLEYPSAVATRYCGHVFAAHGATVVQIGRVNETGVGYGGAASAAYARWLDADKRRVDDFATAIRACDGGIDLVIAGQDAATIAAADEAMRAGGLVNTIRVGVTWFAPDGPYAAWTGSDAVIQAMSGVSYATGPKDGAPILPRGHAPQVVAGATAFVAGLAALLGRDTGWRGRRIDLNILEANLCFSESGAAHAALTGSDTVRRGVNRFTPTFPGGIYRAGDGWIGVTALTPAQWISLCELIGHPELAQDPRHHVALQRLDDADQLDPILIPALERRPAAYWLEEGQRRRIPIAPVPSLADLPSTPHWQERGSFGAIPGVMGAVGPTMPFRTETLPPADTSPTQSSDAPGWPLCGLRVLDLSMGWAGPLAARHLADLGADVVKVESCTHFDWWRGYDGPIDGDPPPYETRPNFLLVNRNKRGVTLDLKTETGKALVRELAQRSDIMIENYAPGVLDKLGIGTRSLTAIAPALVCLSMGAFGAKGPWRGFRAYGSTVEQASGLPFVNGEGRDPPTMQHVAYGDPVAGLYGAVAGLIALYHRRRSRCGAIIDLGQVECLFQLCADAIVAQSTQQTLLARDGSRHPLSALRMVADTRNDREWIAVSVETVAQWNTLAALVGRHDLAVTSATSTAALKDHELDMERALGQWSKQRVASETVSRLQEVGVPAGPVHSPRDLLDDAQLRAAGFWRRAERRFIGDHVVSHAPYHVEGARPPLRGVAPTLGEHNRQVLVGDLGLSHDDVDRLRVQGVIGTRAVAGD